MSEVFLDVLVMLNLTPIVHAIVMASMHKIMCEHLLIVGVTVLLSGCVSHDGTYLPGCAAYAGNRITLDQGSFVWEKFTDAVVVDDDGNVVDQFPGYPLEGSYRIDGQMVQMEARSGEPLETMYLQNAGEQRYLLTAEEFAFWQQYGTRDDCALQLISSSER
jgi:hypothetical protein